MTHIKTSVASASNILCMQHKTSAMKGRGMSRFLILCKHESESDKIKKWLLELRCAISKANNSARASAVKIDEWLGSRLLLTLSARMATALADSPNY